MSTKIDPSLETNVNQSLEIKFSDVVYEGNAVVIRYIPNPTHKYGLSELAVPLQPAMVPSYFKPVADQVAKITPLWPRNDRLNLSGWPNYPLRWDTFGPLLDSVQRITVALPAGEEDDGERIRAHRHSVAYRTMWFVVGLLSFVWGAVFAASFVANIGVAHTTAVFGAVATIGLMVTLVVAGRSNATSVPR